MTELLFIRHGLTDYNVQQRFQGQVAPPLNTTGQEQARRLGTRLAADRHDVLVASDLLRTRQTAAPLAAAWTTTPALMPGSDCGRYTRRKAVAGLAPRERAART